MTELKLVPSEALGESRECDWGVELLEGFSSAPTPDGGLRRGERKGNGKRQQLSIGLNILKWDRVEGSCWSSR